MIGRLLVHVPWRSVRTSPTVGLPVMVGGAVCVGTDAVSSAEAGSHNAVATKTSCPLGAPLEPAPPAPANTIALAPFV